MLCCSGLGGFISGSCGFRSGLYGLGQVEDPFVQEIEC